MKVSVLFHMKSEICLFLLVVTAWKCKYFWIFLTECFISVSFRFSWVYFLTIRIAQIKKQHCLYLDFLEAFPCYSSLPDFMLKRDGQLNGWAPLAHFDWYHSNWKWNSSSTLIKRHTKERVYVIQEKKGLLVFIISLFWK